MLENKIAIVALFSGIDKYLSYAISDSLANKVKIGSLVKVPLRGTIANAIVLEITDKKPKFKLKNIYSLVQEEVVLSEDLIELAKWMKQYYACGMQSIFESMIPSVVRAGKGALQTKKIYLVNKLDEQNLNKLKKKAPQQAKLYELLEGYPNGIYKSALLKLSGTISQTVDALIKKGIFTQELVEVRRDIFADDISKAEMVSHDDHILNEEQKTSFEDIVKDIDKGEFTSRVLYGITGSGKTEVYIQAIKHTLAMGGDCIFLVPEISLTPQTVGRLQSRLGECIVWHSNLSDGQRLDAWRQLSKGKAKLVVGARSSIFAPVKNLRLIIVDEEHDSAYKQDKNPRYNARDIAVMRAKLSGGVCVLGSATPSLETLYNVKQNKYSISKMQSRIDGASLPDVFVVDMKRQKSMISQILATKIGRCLDKNEQIILFLNRRGYSKIFECPDCGYVEECPHCAISLTLHKKENIVKCHLCGYVARTPRICRNCKSENVLWKNHGTQKIEEVILKMFPNARVGRMDADLMQKRQDYRKTLADFRLGKLDILIGTQMIAKGLDFPRVTLVGVINADVSLNMPDFRAAERTYQLIVQVAGRAGRGTHKGEVIVQTRQPEALPIQYARRNNLEEFLELELNNRLEFNYPPSTKLIRQIFRSRNEEKLKYFTSIWAEQIEKLLPSNVEIKGPAPAPVEKIQDYWRWHIWYFCKSTKASLSAISTLRQTLFMEDVEEILDIDPLSLM